MNIYNVVKEIIKDSIRSRFKVQDDLLLNRISSEPPKNIKFGDLSTNVAMILSKPLRQRPNILAKEVSEIILKSELIAKVDIVNPGFINIFLKREVWNKVVFDVLNNQQSFGFSNIGDGKSVNIEYVSANPTGPLHIGHARGAIFGDVLSELMTKNGFIVDKEYYINDDGNQIRLLARTVRQRCIDLINGKKTSLDENMYKGEYIIELAKIVNSKMKEKILGPEKQWLDECSSLVVNLLMIDIKNDLKKIGIQHNIYTSEKNLTLLGKVQEAYDSLNNRGLLYKGIMQKPQGKVDDEWEPREQILFSSTKFGDDIDRPLRKTDKSWTYFAVDVAYHNDKINRGYDEIVNIWGADHGGYVKRIEAAVEVLKRKNTKLSIKLCQMVNISESGRPLKMSKRSGDFITLNKVVNRVGSDVIRFMMLTRKNDAQLDFDLNKVVEQSKDNPVFYVQYAHARICSAKKIAIEAGIKEVETSSIDFDILKEDKELIIMKVISQWPRVIESAVLYKEPHRIVYYLQNLSSELHSYWSLGKSKDGLKIIVNNDIKLTNARLALIDATRVIISLGLNILGIKPLKEM